MLHLLEVNFNGMEFSIVKLIVQIRINQSIFRTYWCIVRIFQCDLSQKRNCTSNNLRVASAEQDFAARTHFLLFAARSGRVT